MSNDPVSPRVTFDNYVVPETVHEYASHVPQPRMKGTVIAVSVIAVLTFLLGILTTLQFVGTGPAVVAQAPAAQAPKPIEATPESLQALVNTSIAQDEVTREDTTDLLSTTPSTARAEPAAPLTLEAAVLSGLAPVRTVGKLTEDERVEMVAAHEEIVSRNKLRMLREGVLAGLYTVKSEETNGKKRIVLSTINAELTGKSMANLLALAAREGQIEVPKGLNTSDGEVDFDTLLFNLVQTSLATDGTIAGAEAARDMSRRAFAASSAKTREVKGERVYVVEAGDSLAYISLQFYGQPSEYEKIYQANREVLSSPDRIQIGQRLIIPG